MNIVYANETLGDNGIFLAGPTPRSADVKSWRPEAIEWFEKYMFFGSLFIPETRGDEPFDWERQVAWEEEGLARAKAIMFWVPREMKTMPALTTNIEFGMHLKSGKVVLGTPSEAQAVRYMRHYAEKYLIPTEDTLEDTVKISITMWHARGGK